MKKLLYIFLLLTVTQSYFANNSDKEKKSSKVVAGKVTNSFGESISGAKITVAETGETVFADLEGNFKLTLKTDKEYSIAVNTLGYQPVVLKSGSLNAFSDISLKEL